MSLITETKHAGEFVLTPPAGERHKDNGTILSGQNVVAGEVLTADMTAATVTGAAGGKAGVANTGNGTIGTLSAGVQAKEGKYTITFVKADTNLGDFIVEDPDGINVGNGIVGTEFAGDIIFTITDGSTDMAAGDQFTVTVATVTRKWRALPNDGTKEAEGIAWDNYDASAADKAGVIVVRDCPVNDAELTWPGSISAANKAKAKDELSRRGIIVRS